MSLAARGIGMLLDHSSPESRTPSYYYPLHEVGYVMLALLLPRNAASIFGEGKEHSINSLLGHLADRCRSFTHSHNDLYSSCKRSRLSNREEENLTCR